MNKFNYDHEAGVVTHPEYTEAQFSRLFKDLHIPATSKLVKYLNAVDEASANIILATCPSIETFFLFPEPKDVDMLIGMTLMSNNELRKSYINYGDVHSVYSNSGLSVSAIENPYVITSPKTSVLSVIPCKWSTLHTKDIITLDTKDLIKSTIENFDNMADVMTYLSAITFNSAIAGIVAGYEIISSETGPLVVHIKAEEFLINATPNLTRKEDL